MLTCAATALFAEVVEIDTWWNVNPVSKKRSFRVYALK